MRKSIYFVLPVSVTLLVVLFLAHSSRVASLSSQDGLQTSIFITSTITETQKLIASDGMSGDSFGVQLALDGNIAAISAERVQANRGAAYVFQRDFKTIGQWNEVIKISADDGQPDDQFGIRIAVDDDLIVVGAPFSQIMNVGRIGAAYVFQRDEGGDNNWGQVDKLVANDSADGALFGLGTAIFENTIVIGASASAANPARPGQIYIFEPHPTLPNQWEEVQILTPSDTLDRDSFGGSVDIADDLMVVGSSSGAYIFSFNEVTLKWEEERKLTTEDIPDTPDMQVVSFGWNVAISGDIIIVSAERTEFNNIAQGAAFVFSQNQGGVDNWGWVKTLTAESATEFGISLDIDSDLITVSGRSMPTYVYQRNKGGLNNWGETAQLMPSTEITGTDFGIGSAISGETVLVGARHTDGKGAAYIYELDVCCRQYLPMIQK